MFGLELDEELKTALDNIKDEFTGTLKRGYTNVGIRKFRGLHPPPTMEYHKDFQFKDVHVKEDDNNVILKNLQLIKALTSRMSELQPDLLHNVLEVVIDFNNISLVGDYTISNDNQLKLLPIQQFGKIKIIIENVKCYGRIGFTSHGGDAFHSSNFDLDFETGSVLISVHYAGSPMTTDNICSEEIKSNIDESIAKMIKRELWWKALKSIQQQLDDVLIDFSLTDLFVGEKELISKYNLREQFLNDFVNKIIDQFLQQYQQVIQEKNLYKIEIDNLMTKFPHTFGSVTIWGDFNTFSGNARNLNSIRRIDDFSIAINKGTSELTIFGNFQFDELGLIFNKYEVDILNIYTAGNIKATIYNNTIGFKIIIATSNPNVGPFKIRRYELKTRQLENIDVEITGLNLALHWLRLYIITLIAGYFSNTIIDIMEKKMKSIVDLTMKKSYYID